MEDDDDEMLANFLESEVLSELSDQEELKTTKPALQTTASSSSFAATPNKKPRLDQAPSASQVGAGCSCNPPWRIETGLFSKIPPELFHHILKFLSSEDLISCSLVCRFLNSAAADESLWRRLFPRTVDIPSKEFVHLEHQCVCYCMRWGLASPAGKLRVCAWKKLYIQRDEEDMIEFVKSTPDEFREYYIQMQAAKRSQAPLPSQVKDDSIILDRTVADQVSIWKSSRGLTDDVVTDHVCSGKTCSYSQIADVFLCEKTGQVHVCDETCREAVFDPCDGHLVCTISGHCFDRLLSPSEEETDTEQQGGVVDEAEPFMGSGRFARAYLLGYNCADEKELEAALRFC